MSLNYTCGIPTPSGCVVFTGVLPAFIPEQSIDCDASIDDILSLYGAKIDAVLDSVDLKGLDKKSYSFSPATVKVKDFAQETIDKIQTLESSVASLQTTVQNLNVGALKLTVDLKCLKPAAAGCVVGTNQYTLLSLIQLLVTEICTIKSHLNL